MSRPYPVAIVVEEVLHWCYTNGKGAFVYGSHMYVFQRHIWHIVFCVCCAGITCPTADVVPASAATKPCAVLQASQYGSVPLIPRLVSALAEEIPQLQQCHVACTG